MIKKYNNKHFNTRNNSLANYKSKESKLEIDNKNEFKFSNKNFLGKFSYNKLTKKY